MYIYTIKLIDGERSRKIRDICGPANSTLEEARDYAELVFKDVKKEYHEPEKLVLTRRCLPGI